MGTHTATPSLNEMDLTSHSLANNASQRTRPQFTRLGGGQPLSTPATARPHARPYRTIAPHKHKTMFAPTTAITPGPDLPPITCIEEWARLLQTHTHEAFATFANLHGNHTCPPVIDSSSAAFITPYIVQHYAHGSCHGITEVQECLTGLFRLLNLNPSVSLLQQQEIDQTFLLGGAPQRWKREHHFLHRDSYWDPLGIPTCCGPWHNGSDHFVTFYLCQEY